MKVVKLYDLDENYIKNIEIFDYEYKWMLNGDHTLIFSTLDPDVQERFRILYKDRLDEWREFIVTEPTVEHDEDGKIIYEIYCEDSFYETLGDFIEDKRPKDVSAQGALSSALETTRWSVGQIDDLGIGSTNFYRENVKEAIQGKLIPEWKAEFWTRVTVYGNQIVTRYVDLYSKMGDYHGKRFVYDKDLTRIKRTIDSSGLCTALYGYGKGEEIIGEDGIATGGYGRRIDFADVNDGKAYVENVEATLKYGRNSNEGKKPIFDTVLFDECVDKAELKALTLAKLETRSRPKVTYECDVIDLGMDFERVNRGDTVVVKDNDLDITVTARVIEYSEKDNDVNRVVLGDYQTLFTDELNRVDSFLNDFREKSGVWDRAEALKEGGINASYIDDLLHQINTEMDFTKSRTMITDGEGIISESMDGQKAIQILGGGFRIANTKNADGTWKWTTIGDGDGLIANYIVAGVLIADLIKSGVLSNVAGDFVINLDSGQINIKDLFIYDPVAGTLTIKNYATSGDLSSAESSWQQTANNITQTLTYEIQEEKDAREAGDVNTLATARSEIDQTADTITQAIEETTLLLSEQISDEADARESGDAQTLSIARSEQQQTAQGFEQRVTMLEQGGNLFKKEKPVTDFTGANLIGFGDYVGLTSVYVHNPYGGLMPARVESTEAGGTLAAGQVMVFEAIVAPEGPDVAGEYDQAYASNHAAYMAGAQSVLGRLIRSNKAGGEITSRLYVVPNGIDYSDHVINSTETVELTESVPDKVRQADSYYYTRITPKTTYETASNASQKADQISLSVEAKADKAELKSQINLDTSGVLIEGKNLELNGQTQVNGDFGVSGQNIVLDGDVTMTSSFKVPSGNVGLLNADHINAGTLTVNSIGTHQGTVSNQSGYLGGSSYNAWIDGSATSFNANSSIINLVYGSGARIEVSGRVDAKPNGNHHSLELNGLTIGGGSAYYKWNGTNAVLYSSGFLNLDGVVKIRGTEIYLDGGYVRY